MLSNIFAPRGRMVSSLALFGIFSAMTNFPEGYSNSYPNTSFMSFKTMINDSYVGRQHGGGGLSENFFTWYWSLALNIWFAGYLVGTFLTPLLTERYGRKISLLIANFIALAGSIVGLVSVLCKIPELFIFSRIVSSISSGISFGSLILFLQETAATQYRGMTSFFAETTFILCNVLGIAFGMNAIFGKNLPALTGVAIVPAVLATILTLPLKETPKYLLLNRRDRDAAMKSLIFYQGENEENDQILDEMLLEVNDKKIESITSSVVTVLTTPHLRTAFFIGCLALQVVVGIWPIIYLSTDMLSTNFSEEVSQLCSLLFIVANFSAGVCGMFIIERFNRRTLVLTLGILNTLSLILYVVFDELTVYWTSCRWGTVGALVLNGITYGVGLGPIAFFITSELVAQQYRSIVQSMVFAVNTTANFIFSFATLPAFTKFRAWSFVPLFIIPSTLSLVYLYLRMPETKGREVHEIVEELMIRKSTPKKSQKSTNLTKSGKFIAKVGDSSSTEKIAVSTSSTSVSEASV